MNLKSDSLQILKEAVQSVKPANIFDHVNYKDGYLNVYDNVYNLTQKSNVYVLASGKASIEMAAMMKNILKDRFSGGLVVSNYHKELEGFEVIRASHPLPDDSSLKAGGRMLEFVNSCESGDFVIYLLSGGTSSLLEYPVDGIDISDINLTTDALMRAGADIKELNTIRKKLSRIKGGGLASTMGCVGVVFVLSDVVGDDLNFIGSAPLYYNSYAEINSGEILDKYNLYDKLPDKVIEKLISEGSSENIKSFKHYIIGNNNRALLKASQKAKNLGYNPIILTSLVQGEASTAAGFLISILKYHSEKELLKKPLCFIAGGETTVTVKGDGKGGRNQEMALAGLVKMAGYKNIALGCMGTDGIDGSSDAAGAVVTPDMLEKTDIEKLQNFLLNNDSNTVLADLDAVIKTGNTGTNVCDIYIGLVV